MSLLGPKAWEMEQFDKLPDRLRAAIKDTAAEVNTLSLLEAWVRLRAQHGEKLAEDMLLARLPEVEERALDNDDWGKGKVRPAVAAGVPILRYDGAAVVRRRRRAPFRGRSHG